MTLDAAERDAPLELPGADDPERRQPVLTLNANARGQDAADFALDTAGRPARLARPAGRR